MVLCLYFIASGFVAAQLRGSFDVARRSDANVRLFLRFVGDACDICAVIVSGPYLTQLCHLLVCGSRGLGFGVGWYKMGTTRRLGEEASPCQQGDVMGDATPAGASFDRKVGQDEGEEWPP